MDVVTWSCAINSCADAQQLRAQAWKLFDAQAMDMGLAFAELRGHGPVAAHRGGLQRGYFGLHWSLASLHGIAAQHGASPAGARCGQYLDSA
eukprot:Skav232053  [mRNA]  locus=scaffold1641:25088:25889:+ [translate_table: standard]